MDLRHQRKQSSTHAAAAAGAAGGQKRSIAITPAYNGPRRLAFRIRRRGFTFEGSPSLLIIDRYGVWSVTHRRYIRNTRRHRFRDLDKDKDLQPVRDKVRRYKMEQWPQYRQDEELGSLRRKLADLYWSLMPEEEKRAAVLFYRRRRQRQRKGNLMCFAAAVAVVALNGFVLLSLVLMGCFSLRVRLFLGLGYLALVFLLDRAAVAYDL